MFHQLTMEQIERIVDLQLEKVRARLAERKIALELTPAAVERIGLDGFDPVFGARPLKRVIQREVVDAVAKAIIDGDGARGRDGDGRRGRGRGTRGADIGPARRRRV